MTFLFATPVLKIISKYTHIINWGCSKHFILVKLNICDCINKHRQYCRILLHPYIAATRGVMYTHCLSAISKSSHIKIYMQNAMLLNFIFSYLYQNFNTHQTLKKFFTLPNRHLTNYRNDLKILNRQVWANSVDPDQTVPSFRSSLIWDYTVCHSLGIFRTMTLC